MRQSILFFFLVVALAGAAQAADPVSLTMYVGEARVLDEPGIKRLVVGNGEVVNTKVLDSKQILVLAESEGQSTIHLWHRDGAEGAYSVTVISADTNRLLSEVNAMIGNNPKVSARVVGDKILLEGTDLGDEQTTRLVEIGKRYPQVVNLISRVGLERMVQIDVRIMEFRKTKLRDLGIRWQTQGVKGPSFGVVGDVARDSAFRPPSDINLDGINVRNRVNPFATALSIESTILSTINAAVTEGDAVFLAEPQLTCKSGGTAKFLAGGEIPIPLVGSFGQASVQFKPYGVKLEIEPVVSESELIRLKAFTELSAVDGSVAIQGIPGFITRRTETEVNLRPGETLVVSGLFDGSSNKSLDKVPGIGDIPVLGELFRSRQFRRNKTDLVIFLTPHVIAASDAANQDAVRHGEERRNELMKGTFAK
jgi:pilus assembly protein CpaC